MLDVQLERGAARKTGNKKCRNKCSTIKVAVGGKIDYKIQSFCKGEPCDKSFLLTYSAEFCSGVIAGRLSRLTMIFADYSVINAFFANFSYNHKNIDTFYKNINTNNFYERFCYKYIYICARS